jgi:hypothetical protein
VTDTPKKRAPRKKAAKPAPEIELEDVLEFGDDDPDQAYAEGDVPLDEIDWDEVVRLDELQKEALAAPEEDRPMAMLGLLHEMYPDDLEIL